MSLIKIKISRVDGALKFTPQTVSAKVGDQIFWLNNDTKSQQPSTIGIPPVPLVDPIPAGESSDTFTPSKHVQLNPDGTPVLVPDGKTPPGTKTVPVAYQIVYVCGKSTQGVISVSA